MESSIEHRRYSLHTHPLPAHCIGCVSVHCVDWKTALNEEKWRHALRMIRYAENSLEISSGRTQNWNASCLFCLVFLRWPLHIRTISVSFVLCFCIARHANTFEAGRTWIVVFVVCFADPALIFSCGPNILIFCVVFNTPAAAVSGRGALWRRSVRTTRRHKYGNKLRSPAVNSNMKRTLLFRLVVAHDVLMVPTNKMINKLLIYRLMLRIEKSTWLGYRCSHFGSAYSFRWSTARHLNWDLQREWSMTGCMTDISNSNIAFDGKFSFRGFRYSPSVTSTRTHRSKISKEIAWKKQSTVTMVVSRNEENIIHNFISHKS